LKAGLSPGQLQEVSRLADEAESAMRDDKWDVARASLDQALNIDDRRARLYYWRGRCYWQLEEYVQAESDFVKARDEDVCPLRALTTISEIVTEVGQERQVPVIDFEQFVRQTSEHQIPGSDCFLDHVHPTIEMHRQLANLVLEELAAEQIVQLSDQWGTEAKETVRQQVTRHLDPVAHALALRNLSMVLGWAGKFEDARRLALQSLEVIPEDGEARYRAGRYEEALGNVDEAIKHYRLVRETESAFVDAANNLGAIYARRGDFPQAIEWFQKVLARQPGHVAAQENLRQAMADWRRSQSKNAGGSDKG
jgi:tetratricopeptide (TPR) repeat protein